MFFIFWQKCNSACTLYKHCNNSLPTRLHQNNEFHSKFNLPRDRIRTYSFSSISLLRKLRECSQILKYFEPMSIPKLQLRDDKGSVDLTMNKVQSRGTCHFSFFLIAGPRRRLKDGKKWSKYTHRSAVQL